MKRFAIVFFSLFALEMLIYGLHIFFYNKVISLLHSLISLPALLIDRSYPFYAMGSGFFQLSLLIGNLLVQTVIILMIAKIITRYRKSNSL